MYFECIHDPEFNSGSLYKEDLRSITSRLSEKFKRPVPKTTYMDEFFSFKKDEYNKKYGGENFNATKRILNCVRTGKDSHSAAESVWNDYLQYYYVLCYEPIGSIEIISIQSLDKDRWNSITNKGGPLPELPVYCLPSYNAYGK
ncbi:hypothetical protein RLOatenuis_6220 [Rickettsiales bacterium]|nr:hypothetical protein RLOatenuis_6220 [Rickettsiales bacterium]